MDMDDTTVDFQTALIERYNERTGEGVTPEQFLSWEMTDYVQQPELLVSIFMEPGFFLDLKPIPGALEAVREVHELGQSQKRISEKAEVVFLSSPCSPHCAMEKMLWLKKYAPWLPQDNLILGRKKHMVKGNILVDDARHFAARYKKFWPTAKIVGIEYPHNQYRLGEDNPFDLLVPDHTKKRWAWQRLGPILTGLLGYTTPLL